MNVSEKIKKIRKDNNLSQERFAEMIGISRQSVIAYENGKTIPHTDVLLSICNVFSIDLNYFVEGTEKVVQSEEVKEELILNSVFFDNNTFEKEMKYDIEHTDFPRFRIVPMVLGITSILSFILAFFIDAFLLIFIVNIIVYIIVNKKSKKKWYLRYFCEKRKSVFSRKGVPLSPIYYIYLDIINDHICIHHNDKILFKCSIERFDHYSLMINNQYQTKFFNVNPNIHDYVHTLILYVKDVNRPIYISFSNLHANKYANEMVGIPSRYMYINCLNNAAMKLKEFCK